MIAKEYSEVLALTRGLVSTTLRETADGFQIIDLLPVLSENLEKALIAYEGGELIAQEWQANMKECLVMTADFVIDMACDVLKLPGKTGAEFKETSELIALVDGLTRSVVAKLPGGLSVAEILTALTENIGGLMVGLDGLNKVGDEFKSDIRSFLKVTVISVIEIAFKVRDAVVPAESPVA